MWIVQQPDRSCWRRLRELRIRRLREVRVIARPRVGVTTGDPAGIGPEIARKAAADARVSSICDVIFYGPSSDEETGRFERGRVSATAGRAAYDAIVAATSDATAGR